jgi:hypothetical protein
MTRRVALQKQDVKLLLLHSQQPSAAMEKTASPTALPSLAASEDLTRGFR